MLVLEEPGQQPDVCGAVSFSARRLAIAARHKS